jgi:hypothetical protein
LLIDSINGSFGPQNADRDASGATIDFDFNPAVTSSSFLLIAHTNATASQSGILFLNSATGAPSVNIAGFVPGHLESRNRRRSFSSDRASSRSASGVGEASFQVQA